MRRQPKKLGVALGALSLMATAPFASPAAGPTGPAPLEVALLVDTSGSIGRRGEAPRNRLAAELADSLPDGSGFVVFSFDDEPRVVHERTTSKNEVAQAVSGLRSQGRFTALNDTIFDAVRALSQGPAGKRAIVVITDGLDENSALLAEDGVNAARELRIPVFAVGIGNVHERYLRRIAKLTAGEYFPPRFAAQRIAAQIVATTPSSPPAVAQAPPQAPPQAAPGEARKPAAEPASGGWAAWGPVAVVVVLAAGALVFLRRRQPPLPSAAQESTLAGAAQEAAPDEATVVTRLELGEPSSPTLVLTLKPLLHVTRGPNMGRFFEVSLDTATSIGRAKGNDVTLDDRAISGQHCRIRPGGGVWEIFDLKSTNGTFVNERKVVRQPLAAGDVIKIGETVMQFRMDHMRGSPSLSPS